MSGIAGWVDYERDLSRETGTIRAMTATMACRGPDAEGIWAGRHALLGHRLLDLGGDATPQPLEAHRDADTAAVVAFAGEVYNAPEVRARLAARGHRFQGRGPAEVALAAYLEWGHRCAEHLTGGYAFAVWDARREELLLVRDRLGNAPLFYHPTAAGAVFASERKAILAHPLVEPAVDLDGLRELLSYAGTPGHGVFRGVHQVRPGHVVRVGRDGVREERYWALEGRPHTDDLPTTVDTVRGLLTDAVAGQLDADVPLGMMLSGGLDSSGVTALAARALDGSGRGPLRTFSVAFGAPEDFEADEVWSTPDAPFVAEMVHKAGTRHTDIAVGTGDLLDPLVARNALRAKDVPTPLGNMNTSLYVLFRAVREHTRIALLGDAADGVFGGVMWVGDDRLVKAETFPWVAMAGRVGAQHGLGTDLLSADLLGALDVRGYAAERYREAMARVPHVEGESSGERRMREIWYINVTNWLETLIPHSESIAQSVGLALRLPYCDHRLVQYVFNAPWAMKGFDGREKSLLRAALSDVLPASVLDRRKSPYPVTQDAAYAQGLCAELARVLADPSAPVADLVDREAAARVIADSGSLVAGRGVWVARTHAEMLLQLNMWLGMYGVRLHV
ncbi:asparagine synthase (glutamine-hydrolyzing) [Nocardiopsis sediminis]|uniref:asparagine synthase (glutamine-hydrolyzing) n=1 Tax=Nocardiopsis sediminis TaxID=1778267 RepID=A0ABV8FNF0_9ACTN